MTNNPLLKLLPYLNRKEMTRFRDFARSPYFNKHSDVQRLVEYLYEVYPNFTDKKCAREVIFRQLYPALPHDQQRLAVLFTYALRLLEQFLRIEEAKSENLLADDVRLLRCLRKREAVFYLEKIWQENAGKVNADTDKISRSNLAEPGPSIRWADEMDASAMRLARHDANFLAGKQEQLDANFLSEKLKDACELLQRSQYLKQPFAESSTLRAAVQEVEAGPEKYQPFPSVTVFYHCFQLLRQNDPSLYRNALDTAETLASSLVPDDLQRIFNYLQNFCIAQINQGNGEFLRKLFDIYRSQLERELLLVNGVLPEWHFKNIVTTGLRLDEHEWVRLFLEKYRPLLPPDVAENAYSYNLAAYYYHLRRYDDVLHLLVQVEYTDLRYNLDAKSLLLRTYFDLGEEDPLLALNDAFRQYLKRNRSLTDFQKKGYFNLLKFTRKAFRLKMDKGFSKQKKWDDDLKKLEAEVGTAETVFNLGWLLGKIESLKN